MAGGLMNLPKLPGIPGIHNFKGKMFHSAGWDYHCTGGAYGDPVLDGLADKRVAIVGTGATSIQAVPYLARYAKHPFVLHRTPSTVDELLQSARAAEGWAEITLEELLTRREVIDHQVMARLRASVDALVNDPETAELLKPWFRFPCKRPLSNNDYYPSFNQPNVTLVDVSSTQGVERMTETGFVSKGKEYEVDCMILASGFEVTSELERGWGIPVIEGRDRTSIYRHWKNGPETLHA